MSEIYIKNRSRRKQPLAERIINTPKMRASLGISPVFRGNEGMLKMPYPNFVRFIEWAIRDDIENGNVGS